MFYTTFLRKIETIEKLVNALNETSKNAFWPIFINDRFISIYEFWYCKTVGDRVLNSIDYSNLTNNVTLCFVQKFDNISYKGDPSINNSIFLTNQTNIIFEYINGEIKLGNIKLLADSYNISSFVLDKEFKSNNKDIFIQIGNLIGVNAWFPTYNDEYNLVMTSGPVRVYRKK